jgi:hypothetical protein
MRNERIPWQGTLKQDNDNHVMVDHNETKRKFSVNLIVSFYPFDPDIEPAASRDRDRLLVPEYRSDGIAGFPAFYLP